MDFVAIDFETANEKRNSACALGITLVRNGEICDTTHQLLRPIEMRFSEWNVRVHGITEEDVTDCPTLAEYWPSIVDLIENRLVIAHNASFDISVLRHSLYSSSVAIPYLSYLCSCRLSQQAWPDLLSHSLGYLADYHGIPLEHHNAGSDAAAAASLVLTALRQFDHSCPRSLASSLGVTIGEVFSEDEWIPSTAPSVRRDVAEPDVIIPRDFDVSTHPFFQKNLAFTGELRTFRRESAKQIVAKFGGIAKDSVSKKTDYLVVGNQDIRRLAKGAVASSKFELAKKLRTQGYNLKIISENDFLEMIFHPANRNGVQ